MENFNLEELVNLSRDTFTSLGDNVLEFLLQFILAIVVFLIIWAIGIVIAKLVWRLIKELRVNDGLAKLGFKDVWERSGHKLDAPMLFYEIVKWFFVIVGLMVASDILNLDEVTAFLQEVVNYIDNVFIAAIILVIGVLVAAFVKRTVAASVKAAKFGSAHTLAAIAEWAVLIFVFLIALNELGVGEDFIFILFIGMVSMLALALGLAFGLGGRDHADDALKSIRRKFEG